MPVIVSFMRPGHVGTRSVLVVGPIRVTESVALAGTSTAAARDGEFAYLVNTETAAVRVAFGTTPSTSATEPTAATSAYFALPAGQAIPLETKAGDKIAAATL